MKTAPVSGYVSFEAKLQGPFCIGRAAGDPLSTLSAQVACVGRRVILAIESRQVTPAAPVRRWAVHSKPQAGGLVRMRFRLPDYVIQMVPSVLVVD